MDKEFFFFFCVPFTAVIIGLSLFVYHGAKYQDKLTFDCESRGGKIMQGRGAFYCVDPKIFK